MAKGNSQGNSQGNKANIYTLGGTVQAGDGVYIPRQADEELLALCQQSVFAYVLTSRQMGKSSLMVRTVERLAVEEIQSVVIDLTQLGVGLTAEQWYLGLLSIVEDTLMLDTDVVDWWEQNSHLGFTQRLTQFFEKVLLVEVTSPVVIFIDEIDTTLSLDFTDDFFAAIRYLYVARAQNSEFQRLSFVLIGVATPGDLIRDGKRTPFNIGQRVDLTDFTFEEALPFAEGLGAKTEPAQKSLRQQLLKYVLEWTGGHPYLTQRLCSIISNNELNKDSWSSQEVEQVVNSTFLGTRSKQDNNLQFVRDMLTKRAPNQDEVLTIYRQIRLGRGVVVDEEQSIIKSHLKLSGVVRCENNVLRLRNRIYGQVFDHRWINENLSFNLRNRWEQLKPTLPYVVVVMGLSLITASVVSFMVGREAQLREIQALNGSSQANLVLDRQLEALTTSVKAGKRVKNIIGAPKNIRAKTVNRLQQALSIQEQNRLEGHKATVKSVSYSPDNQIIASASDDQTVKLWSTDGRLLRTLDKHTDTVTNVSFSPDGKTIATASFDGTVKLWRTSDGKLLRTLKAHSAEVLSVAWSPQGDAIASSGAVQDPTIKIWRVSDGRLLKIVKGHNSHINSVALSADGRTLASGSDDTTIKLWRISDGRLLKTLDHDAEVYSVAFSPDGQTLASGGVDKTIKLWRADGSSFQEIPAAHNAQVWSINFSSDGKTLASSSTDGTIKLWNRDDRSLIEIFEGHNGDVYSVAFGDDNQTLISAGADQTVRIWRRQNNLLRTLQGHKDKVYSVKFNPQGNILASASEDTTIKLWQPQTGTLQQNLESSNFEFQDFSGVVSIIFSPDGEILASGDSKGSVKLWRIRDGKTIKTLEEHTHLVNSMSFHRDGNILASASFDETVKLWNGKTGSLLTYLKEHTDDVLAVDFSPSGKILATASRDKTIKLWRVDIPKNAPKTVKVTLLKTLEGHSNAVNGVSFSPDGKILASASSDRTIKLWRVREGTLLRTLEGNNKSIWSVTFSPDGQIIASASGDKTVKLWSIKGTELKTLKGHRNTVSNVSFNPDGKMIASASFDGTIKLWHLDRKQLQTSDLDRLLVRSCKRLNNYLKTNSRINRERSLCSEVNK